ncbi:hypothetical protein L7F22_046459 [Adiantum nelumboides]|nr:hypothetical protein [Adiantum nelumboides]
MAFASLRANIDNSLMGTSGVYCFCVHGSLYHRVGSLVPHNAGPPKFAQMYVYDTDHEVQKQMNALEGLDVFALQALSIMMRSCNPYANAFYNVGRLLRDTPNAEIRMTICENRSSSRQYLIPIGNEVAAILPGQGDLRTSGQRDIVLHCQDGRLQRISNLHRSYMPLLYVLLFPRVLRLFDNMQMRGDDIADIAYCKWLMDIGNGTLTSHEDHTMAIPSDMVLSNQSMDGLISYVYLDMNRHLGDARYFRDRAILAPRNCDVDIVNAKTLCAMSGDIVKYFSADSIIEDSVQQSFLYSVEFLNGLNLDGGFPVHYLQLKLNAPIILLRNLDPSRGLCNGTRLVCKAFHQRVLEAEIVTRICVGTRVFIPRICFIYSGTQLPFVLQ